MSLVSIEVLAWLLGLVAVYWLLPRHLQLVWVSLLTALFLLIYAPLSLGALIIVALVSFFVSKKNIAAALFTSISMLLAYRWFSSGNPMQAVSLRDTSVTFDNISEPTQFLILVGFSYYILRAIHYVIEQMKGRLPDHTFTHYLNYLFFLPTLFVGPINRFDDFMRDTRRRRWDSELFSYGVTRVVFGFTKIVVIAYYLVNRKMGFWIPTLDPSNVALLQYVDCWQYALNLYFQFSGYCDIAIGFGALLGYRINENFNYPFLKPNISEFWRSWHMSLTSWSREYVYPPVAAVTRSPYIAIFISMLFIGLWHEFSPKYLLWGIYHGAGIMLHRYYRRLLTGTRLETLLSEHAVIKPLAFCLGVVLTLHFVVLGFILNKESSLSDSWRAFTQLVGL